MNPKNDAYWHDQANRVSEDDWGHDAASGRSKYQRWADALMDRIQRNAAREGQARRDLKEAERRYGDESLPCSIAHEEYQEAERRWEAERDGASAHQEAASWWQAAQMQRACRAPGEEDFPEFFWELEGASAEEGARVAALEAAAYALVEAGERRVCLGIGAAEEALEKAEQAWAAYQVPSVSGDHSDDEVFATEARLRHDWDRAHELLESAPEATTAEVGGWSAYEKARSRYCEAFAVEAATAARRQWSAAKATWKAAEEANRPAREAVEAAREMYRQEGEACRAEDQAIERARRRS